MFEEQVIPIDLWINDGINWLVENHRGIFMKLKWPVEQTLVAINQGLSALHPTIIITIVTLIAWRIAGIRFAIFSAASLIFIGLLGLWDDTMTTFAMVFSSVIFCIIAGVPLGIWAGRNNTFERMIRPVLDAMQTTPSFVYLVPIVMLFSIGNAAGVLATIIFALPPIIRLTSLGIRQVPQELIEAAQAFGATNLQVLIKVQVPLAMPTILAGLNQTIMMALSMVVVAALIGAGGLGSPVITGLNSLDIGMAAIGGLAIVLMAVMLDRITQAAAQKKQ